MSQYNDDGRKAFPRNPDPDTFLPRGSRVILDVATGYLAAAGDTDRDLGVIHTSMSIDQNLHTVEMSNKPGTVLAISAGAIPYGVPVFNAANGQVAAAGSIHRGTCFTEATGAGQLIEISNDQAHV